VDLYSAIKTLHVLSAITWVGGGLLSSVLGFRATRSGSDEALLGILEQFGWCGPRVFVPASMATLIFGIGMTWLGALWSEVWILVALGGIATAVAIGAGVLGRWAERVRTLQAAGKTEAAVILARRLLLAAAFDRTLVVLVTVDMVLKPSLANWPVLSGLAAIAMVSGLYFLPRALAAPGVLPPEEAR